MFPLAHLLQKRDELIMPISNSREKKIPQLHTSHAVGRNRSSHFLECGERRCSSSLHRIPGTLRASRFRHDLLRMRILLTRLFD